MSHRCKGVSRLSLGYGLTPVQKRILSTRFSAMSLGRSGFKSMTCDLSPVHRLVLLTLLLTGLATACSSFHRGGDTSHLPFIAIHVSAKEKLIVFVHGFLGDAESTWRNSETASYWPRMIERDPEFGDFDVFAYNYESTAFGGRSSIEAVAQRMLEHLMTREVFSVYKEVYFITHSMGGIITKRVLNELQFRGDMESLERVRAVLYISTPAQGAPIVGYVDWLSTWLGLNPQLRDLRPSDLNSFLQVVENQWHTLMGLRDKRGASSPKAYCAYETKSTHGTVIVSRVYTATRCDNVPYAIDLDHFEIAKPRNDEADPYVWSKDRILEAANRKPSRRALPSSHSDRLTVAITRFEHDTRGEFERLTVAALSRLEGVEILRFNRMISLEGPRPQEIIRTGHETAREYLTAAGADLLIWGRVLRRDAVAVLELHWTPARRISLTRYVGNYDPIGVELPATFWSDFADVLRLIVVDQDAEFRALEGQFVADRLGPFIERVRRLLADGQPERGWGTRTKVQVRLVLANSLTTLGEQKARPDLLREAVGNYREVLKEYTRGAAPLEWAKARMNLGNALGQLSEYDAGTTSLVEEALEAFDEGIEEFPRDRMPKEWAGAMNNIGITLARLGEQEAGTDRLERAVAALYEALKELPRDRMPLDWARTQDNLGGVLSRLGSREADTTRLKRAVDAHRDALKEFTRDRSPLGWALTQSNLGAALTVLGEHEGGTARLQEAVATYRGAFSELTRDRVPRHWARTQNNLGAALYRLAERQGGTDLLKQAIAAHQEALKEFLRERAAQDWAFTQNSLGLAFRMLGERESTASYVEEAVVAHRQALEVLTCDQRPREWATTQNNLGIALTALGGQKGESGLLEQAVLAHRGALEVLIRDKEPLEWARNQHNLGTALFFLGQRGLDTARLEQSVVAYREALKERTRENMPVDWATTRMNLGAALVVLGERDTGTARLEEAVAILIETVLELDRHADMPVLQAMTRQNLAVAVLTLAQRKSQPKSQP